MIVIINMNENKDTFIVKLIAKAFRLLTPLHYSYRFLAEVLTGPGLFSHLPAQQGRERSATHAVSRDRTAPSPALVLGISPFPQRIRYR